MTADPHTLAMPRCLDPSLPYWAKSRAGTGLVAVLVPGTLTTWADEVLARELRTFIARAAAALPERQRLVFTLRDVEGLSSAEVCNILAISETNQRVQLHRARSRVRRALARYLEGGGSRT